MRGIVDRIENGIAVVELDDGMQEFPAVPDLQDGDFVDIENGVIIHIDRNAAQQRRAKLQERLDRMRKKKEKT